MEDATAAKKDQPGMCTKCFCRGYTAGKDPEKRCVTAKDDAGGICDHLPREHM